MTKMARAAVPKAVLGQTTNLRLRESMLLGSSLEGGWNPPYPAGDGGTSFGPYQMHEGGALTQFGLTQQQAENANTATKYMLPSYANAVNQISDQEWNNNPEQAAEQAAVIAESPAQDYYSSQGVQAVNQNWQTTQATLKGKHSTGGMPPQEANLTSAGEHGSGLPNLGSWLPSLLGGLFSQFAFGGVLPNPGSFKSDLERIGLVIFGGLLIIVGLVIFAIPAAKAAGGMAISANRELGAVRNLGGAGAKDVARRQAIADRSLALGEQKIALQRQRENRLATNQAARERTRVPRASAG